jgi:hypothetical protein
MSEDNGATVQEPLEERLREKAEDLLLSGALPGRLEMVAYDRARISFHLDGLPDHHVGFSYSFHTLQSCTILTTPSTLMTYTHNTPQARHLPTLPRTQQTRWAVTNILAEASLPLVIANLVLGLVVVVPVLLVGAAVVKEAVMRLRHRRSFVWMEVPGVGRIPVLRK